MAPGYQWFVAWRYTMARPPRWSPAVLVTAAALLFAALSLYIVGNYTLSAATIDELGFSNHSAIRQQILLTALAFGVAGELVVVLALVGRYFTFFTTVSLAGVALGTMAMVMVLSVMSGFEHDLREKILGSNAHILVTKSEDSEFTEYREVGRRISAVPGVVAFAPFLSSEIVVGANGSYANVIVKGIVPGSVSQVTNLEKTVEVAGEMSAEERRRAQQDALKRLWPLSESGSLLGQPPPGGSSGDSPPTATGPGHAPGWEPQDFSGGEEDDFRGKRAAKSWGSEKGGGAAADGWEEQEDWEEWPPQEAHEHGPPPADQDGQFPDAADEVIPPMPARVAILHGMLVGRELVKQIHLYEGQEVRVVSPLTTITPQGPAPRTGRFRIAGTFYTGMYEYDLKFVYVDLYALQDFLDVTDRIEGIEIQVADAEETEAVSAAIRETIGPTYRVRDWKDLNRSLFSALKLEKIAMFIVLIVIVLVASFSIIGDLIMVVVEKAKEIAILKAIGSTNAAVMKIFVVQGLQIGIVGTTIGVIHGLVFSHLAGTYGLPLNPDVYYIDRLPVHVEALSVAAVIFASLAISVVATLYPSYMAARLRPVEGMRH